MQPTGSTHVAFKALIHDAAEAYCQDIPEPLKALLPDHRRIETIVDGLMRLRFALPFTPSPDVKCADLKMLTTEHQNLDISDDDPWPMLEDITPYDEILISPVFYVAVILSSTIDQGAIPDGDTILWWLKQSQEARAAICTDDTQNISDALSELSLFISRFSENPRHLKVWVNGSNFDSVILRSA